VSHLELRGLTKTYGTITAVAGFDLGIKEGECVSLLGPSGCGKSTTLRLIVGLEAPSGGSVWLQGVDLAGVPTCDRRVGMVFQSYALFPHMTVHDNIAFGLKMKHVDRARQRSMVGEILELIRLSGFEHRWPHQLSGGQQQRVALARALITQPAVLLLDEPLGALDRKLRLEMQSELRELQQRLQITTVFVTHDQDEALVLSDRIAVLNRGRLEQVGPPETIFEAPSTRFVAEFVGIPNFFRARTTGCSADSLGFQTTSGLAIRASAEAGIAPGWEGELAVRPERVSIAPDVGGEGANVFRGRVEHVRYLGGGSQLDVRLTTGERVVAMRSLAGEAGSRVPMAGDTVTVSWAPRDTLVLAAR
jgi:spermidine/putrescine ABC transporter ATP-binding subunit